VAGEWTTILVYKDFTTQCGYFYKYTQNKGEAAKGRFNKCSHPSACPLCLACKEKILNEEANSPKHKGNGCLT
jgi:hypothetical protein